MNLILHLSPETEARLKAEAKLTGQTPEALAMEALQDRLSLDEPAHEGPSPSSQLVQFKEWLSNHPVSSVVELDDSRETIYEGRGE